MAQHGLSSAAAALTDDAGTARRHTSAAHRLRRGVALFCAVLTIGGCSAAPAGSDGDGSDQFLADGRRRVPVTKSLPTKSLPTASPIAVAPTTVAPTTAAPTSAAPTTAARPTTTVAPTTTTSPAPTGASARCAQVLAIAAANPPRFSATSTINRPAACMADRPDSAVWSDRWFVNATYPGRTNPAERGHINVSFDAYSTPIYDLADATTTVRVFIASWGWGHNLGSNPTIPWNPAWQPATGHDKEMVILDNNTGTEWALWGVNKTDWGNCLTLENLLKGWKPNVDLCVATAYIGKNADGSISDAVNSTGFSEQAGRGMGHMLAMALLPTLDEIEKGSINHALNMETYGTMFGPACTAGQLNTPAMGSECGYAVAPASRLEWHAGPTDHCGTTNMANTPAARSLTIPEGMRFALDITDAEIEAWLTSRNYTGAKRNTARIFAVALRDYGWITSDTTCWDASTAVEGVANPKSRARWAQLGITSPVTDGTSLLRGLITSGSKIRTIEASEPGFKTATH